MSSVKCPGCGTQLKRRYYRHYGWVILLITVLLFPIEIVLLKTINFLWGLIGTAIGLFLILKKEKHFYFCKECLSKFSEANIADNGGTKDSGVGS
jgi:hypothetical protein